MKRLFLISICVGLAGQGVWPAQTLAPSVEQQRIDVERRDADAAFNRRELECRARFAVTVCIDEARENHHQSLERLRLQQSALDEAQRKQRAAQRLQGIREKGSAGESSQRNEAMPERNRPEAQPALPALPGQRDSSAPSGVPEPATVPLLAPEKKSKRSTDTNRSVVEAQRRAEYQARLDAAQAHRDSVALRNAQRRASGRAPAAGLPVPSAASASQP